ncbi:MAG: hypothetical protein ACR2RV_24960 [Verrucomicrobiales bacterium]
MSSEEIKFDCPECGEGLAIDRRAIGHQVACPFCKDPITVPEIEAPAPIELEPLSLKDRAKAEAPGSSLAEMASTRPESPSLPLKTEALIDEPAVAEDPAPKVGARIEPSGNTGKAGGLPPKRKPGEMPKAMAEDPPPGAGAAAMPADRGSGSLPPAASSPPRSDQGTRRSEESSQATEPSHRIRPNGRDSEVPEGYEEKVRRKRKRRNPDEHRLNPREHPKMVAFDEVVGDSTFRKHPGHGKTPFLKKLGVFAIILGILAAIGLGILKKLELSEPDPNIEAQPMTELEKEFEIVAGRLDEFREAGSVADKRSFVRDPVTNIEGYPTLEERMSEYYGENTFNAHFPRLEKASGTLITQGETEFFRIAMQNKRVSSFLYFEKSAAGYKLDWDSFVGYNPTNWMKFLVNSSGKSESGVFRLIVTRTDYYTGLYQDDKKYQSYSVTDLDSNLDAIAYVVRGTAAEEAIEAEFAKLKMRDKQQVLVLAQVDLVGRGVDGSPLIFVEKVLRNSWLLP